MSWPTAKELADSGKEFLPVCMVNPSLPPGEWPRDEVFVWWDDDGRPLGLVWPHQTLPED